jgi:hypothetical protein
VVQQCPDPERLLALAGQVRVLEHNWELDFYGPPRLCEGPHGGSPEDRPRGRPPGPARRSMGHPGRPSIHLRVLPPPTVAPEPVELTNTLPLSDDTIPLPVEEPSPVGIAAAVTLAGRVARRVGQQVRRRRERGGRLPTPVRRPWPPVPPLPGRGRR